jgi:hypothetical protein
MVTAEHLSNFGDVLSELQKANRRFNEQFIVHNTNIIKQFQQLELLAKQKNKQTSCDFNVLRLFDIGETKHSFLLANLLNPYSEHGQEKLFLTAFLNKLGIACPEKGHWSVTAEQGRIDILLKRRCPHSVVVIENKSNLANDQPNQLYRYWYREIYCPQRHQGIYYSAGHPEYYQIVYLTPAYWKIPSSYSLEKPDGLAEDLPDKLPIEPTVWQFNKHIVEWLEEVLLQMSKNNHRLKEYVEQYIEYWKN